MFFNMFNFKHARNNQNKIKILFRYLYHVKFIQENR